MGLRVKRYGPRSTVVVVGRLVFEPAMIIVITADTPSASARTKTTAPSPSGYRLALSAIDQRAQFGGHRRGKFGAVRGYPD
jgi:hypothetical protein